MPCIPNSHVEQVVTPNCLKTCCENRASFYTTPFCTCDSSISFGQDGNFWRTPIGGTGTTGTYSSPIWHASDIALGSTSDTFYLNIGRGGGSISSNTILGVSALSANITGTNNVAIGFHAGINSTSSFNVAVGSAAGTNPLNSDTVSVGFNAGHTGQDRGAVSVGSGAGQFGQGSIAVAIGSRAGNQNQGQFAIAIGQQASVVNQGSGSIAIGSLTNTTGTNSMSIGQTSTDNGFSNTINLGQTATATSPNQFNVSLRNNSTPNFSTQFVNDSTVRTYTNQNIPITLNGTTFYIPLFL